MTNKTTVNNTAPALSAELLASMTLTQDGEQVDELDPETLAVAEAMEPEIVRLGAVRFRIIEEDASALAVAIGAIENGEATLAMRVAFDVADDAPEPVVGQYVVLPAGDSGISVLFTIWLTYDDLNDPAAPDLGPDAEQVIARDALLPGEALLVQMFDTVEPAAA